MKIMNTPNKSLELSPGVPTTSVAAFSMNVEAVRKSAGQLNSMLYNSRRISVPKVKDVELNARSIRNKRPAGE